MVSTDSLLQPQLWQEWSLTAVLCLLVLSSLLKLFSYDLLFLGAAVAAALLGFVPASGILQSVVFEGTFVIVFLTILTTVFSKTSLLQKISGEDSRKHLFLSGVLGAFFDHKTLLKKCQNDPPSFKVAYMLILGGQCTLIGSFASILLNGLLQLKNAKASFSFFEFAGAGLLCFIAGYYLLLFLSRKDLKIDKKRDRILLDSSSQGVIAIPKEKTILFVMSFFIISAIFGMSLFYAGITSLLLLRLFKVISWKEITSTIPSDLLILIASSLALSYAIDHSVISSLLAKGIFTITYGHPTFLTALLLLVSYGLAHLIPPLSSMILLFPIAMKALTISGYTSVSSMKAAGIALAFGSTFALLSPTHPLRSILRSYRKKEFFLAGCIISLFLLIVCTWQIPRVWQIK